MFWNIFVALLFEGPTIVRRAALWISGAPVVTCLQGTLRAGVRDPPI
jgi:hypothetical protein